jgi:hypothetical protein
MKNVVKCAVLGLSIIAGSLGVTSPANAQNQLVNLKGMTDYDQWFCMGVAGGNMSLGTPIILWQCDGHPDQFWDLPYVSGEGWQIKDNVSGPQECLTVNGNGDGTRAVIEECDTATNELWNQVFAGTDPSGHSCYYFQGVASGRVLGVSDGVIQNGTPIILWDYINGDDDQLWCLW